MFFSAYGFRPFVLGIPSTWCIAPQPILCKIITLEKDFEVETVRILKVYLFILTAIDNKATFIVSR